MHTSAPHFLFLCHTLISSASGRDLQQVGGQQEPRLRFLCRKSLWSFDLQGIGEMYRSYESHSFWPFLSAPTQGIHVNFVRAQQSSYHWTKADLDRLTAYGHGVHTLSDAGKPRRLPLHL